MKTATLLNRFVPLILLGAALFGLELVGSANSACGTAQAVDRAPSVEAAGYLVSGPYAHKNLSLFLIRGRDTLDYGEKVLTLADALRLDKVVVRETSNVNELIIVNISNDYTVIIMSGDIVKGGKQDRTIKFDLILGPRSGEVPIAVHCVESGRWRGRGGESTAQFSASSKMLASKDAKLGNRYSDARGGGQSEVWASVAEVQDKLSGNLGRDVRSPASATGFQLTLENEDLGRAVADYRQALNGLLDDRDDVLGYAFAINGEINSADVFGSSEIFRQVWPRLLEAAATEAVSEYDSDSDYPAVSLADVKDFLESAEKKLGQARPVTDRVHEVTRESDEVILFETKDLDSAGAALRRNYLKK